MEINEKTYESLKKYTEIPGPIGHEHRVQAEFIKDVKKYTDDIVTTNVGNVLAHIPGKGKKVVIFGHADEIGGVVLSVTDSGFLRMSRGRITDLWFPYCMVGQKALVLADEDKDVRGVFIASSGHVLRGKERDAKLNIEHIFVDVGASSAEEVEAMGIHTGSPIIWNPLTERLGEKIVFGKAMDDRFTYPVMLRVAEMLKDQDPTCDLYLGSTIQEEYGLRGAQSLQRHGFDVAIPLDIGICGDYPSLPPWRMPISLGKGPVIVYRDASVHYNLGNIKEFQNIAKTNNLPFQHGIFENYGSDGSAMIMGGSQPNLIATPTRYSHMPFEMMHLDDFESTSKLLFHYVTK